jgi:hypothetical protein
MSSPFLPLLPSLPLSTILHPSLAPIWSAIALSRDSRKWPTRTQTANEVLDNYREVPLTGIAIGNGWIDARTQYPAYIEFALKAGLFKEGSEVSFGFSKHYFIHPLMKAMRDLCLYFPITGSQEEQGQNEAVSNGTR